MKTVIMAGGKGTRIASLAPDIPKPMIPIAGKPVLEHEIECLAAQGFDDFIITISHLGQVISDYFGDGSKISPATGKPFGVKIQYFNEEVPLGNAGALLKLRDQLSDTFLLLNGDVFFDVDFRRFGEYHAGKHAEVTLFSHPNDHPYDSGLLVADHNHVVREWLTKEDVRPEWYENRVNAGLHVMNKSVLDQCGIDPVLVGTEVNGKILKVDLDRNLLKPLCSSGRMYCYDSPEYVKDMGTPERYAAVCRDYKSGLIHARNLMRKQKAVFLDRDGTINRYVGFLRSPEQFELLDGTADAIRMINHSSFLAIVATNQPVIARGEVTWEGLGEIHKKMQTLLGNNGAYLDAVYICPHHPHSGYEGEIRELKIDCDCRKPKPGMLVKAAEDYNIDLSASWMIGDSENDILAGKAAGCRTILLGCGDYGQDITADSLPEAIQYIIK